MGQIFNNYFIFEMQYHLKCQHSSFYYMAKTKFFFTSMRPIKSYESVISLDGDNSGMTQIASFSGRSSWKFNFLNWISGWIEFRCSWNSSTKLLSITTKVSLTERFHRMTWWGNVRRAVSSMCSITMLATGGDKLDPVGKPCSYLKFLFYAKKEVF